MAKGPKRIKPRKGPKRFSSYPSRLPAVKDQVSNSLLDALDEIGEQFGSGAHWTISQGRAGTVWVTNMVVTGKFNYQQLTTAFKGMKGKLSRKQLVFIAFNYNELNKKGQVRHDGWASIPGGIQVYDAAVERAIKVCNPNSSSSFGYRYKTTQVVEIHIQVASVAQSTFVELDK